MNMAGRKVILFSLQRMEYAQTTEWRDVNVLRNFSILILACKKNNIDPNIVLECIPPEYNVSVSAETVMSMSEKNLVALLEKELKGKWISMPAYNVALQRMVDELGHPWHLREVGHHSTAVHFGAEAVKRLALRAGLRWLSTPMDGYRSLSQAAEFWNKNKWWNARLIGFARASLSFGYIDGPNGKRSIVNDFNSLRLIKGMNEVFVRAWGENRSLAHTTYRLVPVSLFEIMRKEVPSLQPELDGDTAYIYVNGERIPCGEKVWILPDDESERLYRGRYTKKRNEQAGAIPGIRLLNTIKTQCNRCPDTTHPLYEKGEIYQLNESFVFPHGVLEVSWKPYFSDFLRRALLFMNPAAYIQEYVSMEESTENALKDADSSKRTLRKTEKQLSHRFPNEEVSRKVSSGTFGQNGLLKTKDCVIQVDIANSMATLQKTNEEVWSEGMRRALERTSEIGEQLGVWLYRTTGDGLVGVASLDFGPIGRVPADLDIYEMMDNVFEYCQKLHIIFAEELNVELRIGLDYGENVWAMQSNPLQIDGAGMPLNVSARLEGAAENGTIFVSPSVYEIARTRHFFMDMGIIQVKKNTVHGYKYSGKK